MPPIPRQVLKIHEIDPSTWMRISGLCAFGSGLFSGIAVLFSDQSPMSIGLAFAAPFVYAFAAYICTAILFVLINWVLKNDPIELDWSIETVETTKSDRPSFQD